MNLSKPRGFSNSKFFELPESLEGFEQVRKWLCYHCKKHLKSDSPTRESLSKLLVSFIKFQEIRFGKGATERPPSTRLPMRCFYDFNPGGSLCHIFAIMYRYKAEQSWKKIEFDLTQATYKNNNHINDQTIKMALEIETKLIDLKCFRLPTVFIRPEVADEVRKRITDILERRQGEITEDEEEATHIIYPETETDENYAQPSYKHGKNVMIHWHCMPESYDLLLANTFELPDDISESISPSQDLNRNVWRIAANWVLDLEEYNEWMAEKDYEVDEKGAKKVHGEDMVYKRKVLANKRKRGRSPSSAKTKTNTKTTTIREQKPGQKLAKAQCPDCNKIMTVKALERHAKEQHSNKVFKCEFCGIQKRRESALKDHQRRKHYEPSDIGRPKKNTIVSRRKRSPFRIDVFEIRYGRSSERSLEAIEKNSEMEKAMKRNNEQILEMDKKLEETLENSAATSNRLKVLESLKKKEENETQMMKSRITLLESRQNVVELPSLKNIPDLLKFLNLNSSSSKEDIRTAINLRLMEVSPQSNVSNQIYTTKKMTKEKKLEMSIFYNDANDVLMNWFKRKTTEQIIQIN